MKGFIPLFKRQLMYYFCSPGAYLVMAVFLAVSGLNFCGMIPHVLQERMDMGEILFGSKLFWFAVLAVIALITMRLFTEEKRSGSLELLLTAPVTDTQVVMAKYFGALTFFVVLCAPTIAQAVVIMIFREETGAFDVVPVITGYFMFYLIGACYIAFGLLMSSLTRSQASAGILCFAGISMACFSEELQGLGLHGVVGDILVFISGIRNVLDFSMGIVDTRPLVLCLSAAVFFLFATVKVIEARQWK